MAEIRNHHWTALALESERTVCRRKLWNFSKPLQKAPRIILDVTRLRKVVSLKSVAGIQTGRFSDSGNLYASMLVPKQFACSCAHCRLIMKEDEGWRWLPHSLSKRQSLSTTTVLFRTTFTRTIKLNLLLLCLCYEHYLSGCWKTWRTCVLCCVSILVYLLLRLTLHLVGKLPKLSIYAIWVVSWSEIRQQSITEQSGIRAVKIWLSNCINWTTEW